MISPDGTLSGHLETVGNPDGMNPLVQEVLGLLQQSPAQHHHPRRPVSDLIVLKHNKPDVFNNQPVLGSAADPPGSRISDPDPNPYF
jgi:hypothetical protein